MHDVPATGAEAQLHRGRVHDDVVTVRDGPGELAQHVGPLRAGPEIDFHPLQPGSLLQEPDDLTRAERRHRVRLLTTMR